MFLFVLLASVVPGRATVYVWNGAGSSGNWSDVGNWSFMLTPPANGDILIFQASEPRPVNTNDIANLTLNQIRFLGPGGGYDIRGNPFTVTNNIEATNSAAWLAKPDPELPVGGSPMAAENRTFKAPA